MNVLVENPESRKTISPAGAAVIRTLTYFDIFRHPLKPGEIFQLLQSKEFNEDEIEIAIDGLLEAGLIEAASGYYGLNNCVSNLERRLEGEKQAAKSIKTAEKFSRLIARFPFVRAVALSGSLSKNYMDEHSDIDYFIVTAQGRMWVARTLLVLFKKIFLLNSRKYFCVNYFLSEDELRVPDKNLFTATEVAFLVPTYNYELYSEFLNANSWSKNFLPNFPARQRDHLVRSKKFTVKRVLEKFLSGPLGEKLDVYFFRLTLKFWKKKFSHFDASTFDFRLRSRKNVSKHHPLGFQEKVLTAYEEKMIAFNRLYDSLHVEDPFYA